MWPTLRLCRWRFRATFGHRWGGYLGIVLVVGLLGGLSMAAVVGARRTQSSFPAYLASTNPSDVRMFTEFGPFTHTGYSSKVEDSIARLRYVTKSVDVVGFDGNLQVLRRGVVGVGSGGDSGEAPPAFEGSLNGEFVTADRVSLIRGRMANPARDDEIVMSAGGAAGEGLHLGSILRVGFYSDAQMASPRFQGYPTDAPHLSIALKLVGIVESSNQIVQDDDSALGSQFAIFTPALTRRVATCCAYYAQIAMKIDDPARHEAAVVAEVRKVTPNLGPIRGSQTYTPLVAKAERAIRPESIAFGAFGFIASLAALLICGQVVGRLVRRNAPDSEILRALGAGPAMTTADGLIGVLGAVAVGAVVAVVIAVALSPLAPVGPVRSVYPSPGVAFDWTVLGFGFAVLVLALSAGAVLMSYRMATRAGASLRGGDADHRSALTRAAAASGLPPAAVTGIRSAIGAGSGGDAAPMRSAAFGTVLAVAVVVASITFGASLNTLVSHPPLYGWNWNYVLLSGFSGAEDLPAAQTTALLDADPDIAHWAGTYFEHVRLDGVGVPVLTSSPNASVNPTPLSGHGLQSVDQVVLGPATLAKLHKHVGDTVVANTGGPHSTHLRIVGTATLPTIGGSGSPALQMGTGAVVSPTLYSASDLNQQGSALPGPNAVLITIRHTASPSAALRSLQRITRILNRQSDPDGPIGGVVAVLRPAEIADYRAIGSTPSWLAGILAVGAVGALGLTLVASVRRRRRELALLKAIGFTKRQLAASVAWQSSISVSVGLIFGLPLGIVLGRWLWTMFARGISAVPDPTMPVLSLVLVVAGALAFANLVAAIPGRIAARTPTAVLLRSE